MVIVYSVPATPWGGLVITPGLRWFIKPEDLTAPFIMFDIGVSVAKVSGLTGKVKFTYRTYSKFTDMVFNSGYAPYSVMMIIPDDFNLTVHLKLAKSWLTSSERKVLVRRLTDAGVAEVTEVLVVRRVIREFNQVDASQFRGFMGSGLIYGIPLNLSTALVNTDVKCSKYPDTCVQHARLIMSAIRDMDNDALFHLMGPPIKGVLTRLINDESVRSVDTTSNRVDIIHARYRNRSINVRDMNLQVLNSLFHYLHGSLSNGAKRK